MSGGLPATLDPFFLAEKGASLEGVVPIRNMARLRVQVQDDSVAAQVALTFERDDGVKLQRMHGTVTTTITVICQRCLEPMDIEITAEPDVILLREGESERGLPPEADVLTIKHVPIALTELIEDELLLMVPMVPMHPIEDCPAQRYMNKPGKAPGDAEKPHPLAEIAKKKRK